MSAASEQDPNLLTPSHPNEASPGRNDIVVATNKLEPGEIVPVDCAAAGAKPQPESG